MSGDEKGRAFCPAFSVFGLVGARNNPVDDLPAIELGGEPVGPALLIGDISHNDLRTGRRQLIHGAAHGESCGRSSAHPPGTRIEACTDR